jgi:hypothetical protein
MSSKRMPGCNFNLRQIFAIWASWAWLSVVAPLVPAGAAVVHAGVEHGGEQLVGEGVLGPADDARCAHRQPLGPLREPAVQVSAWRAQVLVQAGAHHAGHHLVDGRAFPPAVHVAFAQAQAAFAHDAAQGVRVFDLDVPRAAAIEMDIG